MSRLSEAIEQISCNRAPRYSPLVDVGGRTEYLDRNVTDYWRLGVRLETTVALPHVTNQTVLEAVKRELSANLVEYAFGEFREPLLALRKHLYEQGDVEGATQVTAILGNMFEVRK